MGQIVPDSHYIKDNNNTKEYTSREKESIHRENWKNVFEDNEDDEIEDNKNVLQYLLNNMHIITSYNNSDISRLNINNLDRYITQD